MAASGPDVLRRLVKHTLSRSPIGRLALSPERYLATAGGHSRVGGLAAKLPVRVPLGMCVGFTGFPYRPDAWHYLVALLRQLDQEPDLRVEDSVLARFHQRFQPTCADHLVAPFTPDVRFRPPLGNLPWSDVSQLAGGAEAPPKDWAASRWYGPSSLRVVQDEYDRMRGAYASIRAGGYDPWQKGFIGGYFLRSATGDLRYVILQGNHRAAILAHLGYESFIARAVTGRPVVIDEIGVHDWPAVRMGVCTTEDALAYFHAYFRTRGFEQAARFGLLS